MLRHGLNMDDPILQADSARLLGELGWPEAIDPLLDYVITSPRYEKNAGLDALRRIGRADVCEQIVPLIDAPNVYDDYYWYCADAIRAAAALTVLALDPSQNTGYFERQYATPDNFKFIWFCHYYSPVILSLPETDERISRLRQWVIERLLQRKTWQPDQLVMMSKALGRLGGSAAHNQLKWFLRFPSRYVRGEAIFSLLRSAPTAEHIALAKRLQVQDPADYVILKSAAALCLAGELRYAAILRTTLAEAQDAFVKATAMELLALLRQEEDIPLLQEGLSDKDPYVRLCAIEALEGSAPHALQSLERCLETDPHPRVRLQAAKTILALMREVPL